MCFAAPFYRNLTIPSFDEPGSYKVKVQARNHVTVGPNGIPNLSAQKRILVGKTIKNVSVVALKNHYFQTAQTNDKNVLLVKINGKFV